MHCLIGIKIEDTKSDLRKQWEALRVVERDAEEKVIELRNDARIQTEVWVGKSMFFNFIFLNLKKSKYRNEEGDCPTQTPTILTLFLFLTCLQTLNK